MTADGVLVSPRVHSACMTPGARTSSSDDIGDVCGCVGRLPRVQELTENRAHGPAVLGEQWVRARVAAAAQPVDQQGARPIGRFAARDGRRHHDNGGPRP
jgi:hypothetical protein